MELDEAKSLIVREGLAANGLVVETRFGATADLKERVHAIRHALQIIRTSIDGQSAIDRELSLAMFELGHQLFINLYAADFDDSFHECDMPSFVGDLETTLFSDRKGTG